MTITKFTMEEVRCFAGRQHFNIRPLTFLVGENSTGKTTTLACFQVLANYLDDGEINFNSHPYSMGIFRDIIRRSKRSEKTFKLGVVQKGRREEAEFTFEFQQKKGRLEPIVKSIEIQFVDGQIVIETAEAPAERLELISYDEQRSQFHLSVESFYLDHFHFSFLLDRLRIEGVKGTGGEILKNFLEKKSEELRGLRLGRGLMREISSFSSSPVRSRPKRTYDPTRENEDPEGSDIPMRLMRIQATNKNQWESLRQRLIEFGSSSGLFQSIDVKRLGRSMGAPFQLQVKVRGPKSNISDVGYGVSQVLPMLVQILDSSSKRRRRFERSRATYYLMQQPEVHLHPRAQAEFSSLLSQIASQGKQSFVVETHSDYMIDRARIEIRKGTIKKDDVSLIYLEPKRHVVRVHNIGFDENGNLEGEPPHFREFFLHESSRLLGFEE